MGMGGSALGRFGWERAAQTFDICTLLLNRQCYWSVAPARIFWLPFARDAMANSYLMATRAYLTTSSYQYLTAQSYLFVGPLELIWLTAHSYLYDGMWSSVRVRKSFKYWTCASEARDVSGDLQNAFLVNIHRMWKYGWFIPLMRTFLGN